MKFFKMPPFTVNGASEETGGILTFTARVIVQGWYTDEQFVSFILSNQILPSLCHHLSLLPSLPPSLLLSFLPSFLPSFLKFNLPLHLPYISPLAIWKHQSILCCIDYCTLPLSLGGQLSFITHAVLYANNINPSFNFITERRGRWWVKGGRKTTDWMKAGKRAEEKKRRTTWMKRQEWNQHNTWEIIKMMAIPRFLQSSLITRFGFLLSNNVF